MTVAVRFLLPLAILCALALGQASKQSHHSAAYQSMERKLEHLARNGELQTPDQRPTAISADEATAGGVKVRNLSTTLVRDGSLVSLTPLQFEAFGGRFISRLNGCLSRTSSLESVREWRKFLSLFT